MFRDRKNNYKYDKYDNFSQKNTYPVNTNDKRLGQNNQGESYVFPDNINSYYSNQNMNETFNKTRSFGKNYSRKEDRIEGNCDLVGDSDFISPDQLKYFCIEDPENIKVVGVECPINSNLMVVDISMNPKGVDEESTYMKYPEYMKNIRRGNTLIEFYSFNYYKQSFELTNIEMARKGMMKFLDLPLEIIETKDNHYETTSHIKDKSKLNARKIIFGPILKALNSGNKIEVYKLIKANGENAQISYNKKAGCWIIASKNVALLARNRNDLEYYYPLNKQGEANRYSFAYIIGNCWFDILEKNSLNSDNFRDSIKLYLDGKTLVGEYVGNQNYQHLVRYRKHTILFYAIVDNYSEENCLTVEEAYSQFKKFNLDVVPYEKIGIFHDNYSLSDSLQRLYIRIAESSIIEEEEGSVLYFTEIGYHKRTLVLVKLKTLEYRVYRKLREKLKNHLTNIEENNSLNSRRKINQFFEEVRIMLQSYNLPMPISFYYKVAETAFALANKFYDKCFNLHRSYIDYIEVIHSIIDKTVDLKSRVIKSDNIMTYDYLVKNEINSKKVIEIVIYAPPVYLSDEFLKAIQKKFSTEIKNTFIESEQYYQINTNIIIYHVNMHNFRVYNKIDDNKFIITFGLNKEECENSLKKLNEKMKNPQFISYNKNESLSPFLNTEEANRKEIMDYFLKSSIEFLENSNKYIINKIKSYQKFEDDKIDFYLKEIDKIIVDISQSVGISDDKIIKESFLYDTFNSAISNNKLRDDKINSTLYEQITSNYKNNKFIKLYEFHKNPYLELKEIFLKEEKLVLYKMNSNESNEKFKKEIVILVPMTIPGTGKTLFVDQLREILSKTKIVFESISSDQIRKDLMDDLIFKENIDKEAAFQRTGKSSSLKFESQLRKKFRNLVENHEKSLLYIDKNHPPNAISRVFEPIRDEIKLIPNLINQCNIKFVALLPDCQQSMILSDNLSVNFSLSYFLQCYVRIKHRKNHQTLNGDQENLICILGMFINNFMNFVLNEENLMLHYHFNMVIRLPFTSEFAEDKISYDLVAAGKEFFKNFSGVNSMSTYDRRAAKFEKLINKYYKSPDSFISTKDLVKSTAEPILNKLFSVKMQETIVKEVVCESNLIAEKLIIKEEIKINSEGNVKINENKEEAKQIKKGLSSLFDESYSKKAVTNNPLDAAKITQISVTSTNKPPSSNFRYLGLVLRDQKEKMINEVFLQAFKFFLTIETDVKELNDWSISLQEPNRDILSNWKFPHKEGDIWHTTTLFKGTNPVENYLSHPSLREFEEGKSISIFLKAVVYVPGRILTSFIDTPANVDNEFPHITLAFCGSYQVKYSNDVLRALFAKGNKLEKDFYDVFKPRDNGKYYLKKVEVRIDGMYVNCYVVKLNPSVKFEAKMHAFN